MKSLDWDEKGIRIDGKFLSNLRFADDIVIFSRSTSEAEMMINELKEAGIKIGLRINRKKTKFIKETHGVKAKKLNWIALSLQRQPRKRLP
uniref:Reverse transcriptase domain-containing protein n=1 Tax=Angiostrongylus cantonensis TaxID=6313 RepID=A0A0K0CYC1_ANGCA